MGCSPFRAEHEHAPEHTPFPLNVTQGHLLRSFSLRKTIIFRLLSRWITLTDLSSPMFSQSLTSFVAGPGGRMVMDREIMNMV